MNKQELRIGNLVQSEGMEAVTEIQSLSINSARGKYIRIDTGESHISLIDYKYLLGIPLSDEWLLKLGFKVVSQSANEYKCYRHISGKFYFEWDCVTGWEFRFNRQPAPCNHVHEFQNLYRTLIGEELTLQP